MIFVAALQLVDYRKVRIAGQGIDDTFATFDKHCQLL